MIKTLTTLVKYYTRQLEEKRRALVALETERQQVLEACVRLREKIVHEGECAGTEILLLRSFSEFLHQAQLQIQFLEKHAEALQKKIEPLQEEIMGLFQELKKYDILLERKLIELRQEEQRRETLFLDELSTTRYVLRQDDVL